MKKIILLFLVLFFCLSCKTLLTPSIRARIISEKIPIDKVQFYNTKEIVLFREVNANKGETSHGKVKFINGKYYEFVKFKKNTPCICITDSVKNLEISFEQNGTLKFGTEGNHILLNNDNSSNNSNNSNKHGNYYLVNSPTQIHPEVSFYQIYADHWKLGQEFKSSYDDIKDRKVGQVSYSDSTYLIIEGQSSKLSLKKQQLDKLNSKTRKVKGIKVD